MPHRSEHTLPEDATTVPPPAPSRLFRGQRITAIALLLVLPVLLLACGPTRPRPLYPPPDTLRLAEAQRHEFIHLFLQGRWCEAQGMFDRSLESYQLQDDFCAAAQNQLIAWKLHQYLNLEADNYLDAARELAATGLSCPALQLPDPLEDYQPHGDGHLGAADRDYRELIRQGAFEALADRLRAESDPLFASVYGRKAALAALDRGQLDQARILVGQTREMDARQGWIVFLIEDWKIDLAMTIEPDRQRAVQRRIVLLQDRIQPCSM